MTFKDMPLDLQVRLSLEKHTKFLGIPLSACGVGSYPQEVGRDVCAAYRVLSKSSRPYYIYLQVSYLSDPIIHMRISKLSSIVLFDFSTKTTLAKEHLNSIEDLVPFYKAIDAILLYR